VTYTPTKSGNYEAAVKLAKSGGLTGQYFENVWFFYTPVKTTVNPTINLQWGLGPVTDTGMDFVSIRWQGKVKVSLSCMNIMQHVYHNRSLVKYCGDIMYCTHTQTHTHEHTKPHTRVLMTCLRSLLTKMLAVFCDLLLHIHWKNSRCLPRYTPSTCPLTTALSSGTIV
jgi:hypothetical protein